MKLSFKIKAIVFFVMHFAWVKKIMYMITMAKTRKQGKGHPVQVAKNTRIPVERLNFGRKWTKDPRIDTMYHPTVVQRLIDDNWVKPHSMDCDDHAIYYAAVLKKSGLAKRVWVASYEFILKDTGALEGHALCVFEDKFGNYLWMDYDYPNILSNRWQWAEKSAFIFNADPLVGVMMEVVAVDKNDTPKFGSVDTKSFLK